ncbi:MAG: hypothetical protein L6405_02850 [Actinomycetia bacterium]|nr:hypothetical protein [Actinomycetota bacterium]MCG2788873.1 hypothetical protein [Actinomycetes bacterium]
MSNTISCTFLSQCIVFLAGTLNTANSFLDHLLKKPGHLVLKGTAGSGKTIILK